MSLPRYPKYKDSGVEWLGEVPEHWGVDRFKRSALSRKNGIWGDEARMDEDDIACVRVADFDRQCLRVTLGDPTIRNVTEKEREGRVLKPGDLLLEKSGGGESNPVGCVVLYDHVRPAVCSNFVARVQLAPGMDASFWRYQHAAAYAVRLTTRSIKQTSGIQNLDDQQYFDEKAAFPSSAEQVRIGLFLDSETGKIDALVAEQQRLIELLKEKRQAVISHAVTKGLNPDVPMKDSGNEWLGEVPAHWDVQRISRVSTKITNGYVGPTRDILAEDGVRYLQSLHIKNNGVRFDVPYFVSLAWSMQHAKSILAASDVLIVQTGDIGQAALVTDEFAGCNCHALIIVAPIQALLEGAWLAWVLKADYGFHSLRSIQVGALHPHLNCGDVKDLTIPLPPVTEQRHIVEVIGREVRVFDTLTAEAQRAIELLQERRTALISAAVTGQIDVRSSGKRGSA